MQFELETGNCLAYKPENLAYKADDDEYTYVTGIYLFNESKGVWCVELTFPQQKEVDSALPVARMPVAFKYYLQVGDTLTLRDIENPDDTIEGRLTYAAWNKMTFE